MVNEDNLVVFVHSAFPQYCLVPVPNLVCNEFLYVTFSSNDGVQITVAAHNCEEMQSKNR